MKLLIYDATARAGPVGWTWKLGSALFRRFDRVYGAKRSWLEALSWANAVLGDQPLEQLEFWGHGRWGAAVIGEDHLTLRDLLEVDLIRRSLQAIGEHCSPTTLLWFRTCSTFGQAAGQSFARAMRDLTGARVAGHTFSINAFHSGLHSVGPGQRATWPIKEGVRRVRVADGTWEEQTTPANPWAPNTVTFLARSVPRGW